MYHAGDYWEHNAFSQNAVCLSLVLEYRKELKVGKEDLNVHTLPLYSMAIVNVIANHAGACADRGQVVLYDNYAFIAERAIERIEACKESRLTDESVADESIKALNSILLSLKDNIQKFQATGHGGSAPHPTAQEIRDAFDTPETPRPRGCLFPIILIIVFVIINTISTNIIAKGSEDAPPLTSYTQLESDGGITVSLETTASGIRVDGEYMAEEHPFLSNILYLKLYYIELDGKVIPIVYYNRIGKTPKVTMKGSVLEIDSEPSLKEAVDKLREELLDAEFGEFVIVPDLEN
jgi:hypothetical protein